MPQLLFGGILAAILLGFYIWSIFDAILIVQCKESYKIMSDAIKGSETDAAKIASEIAKIPKCEEFTNNMTFFLNSIGGLISATVVGVLGATKLYEFPGEKLFKKNLSGIVQTIAAYMPSVYILAWMICGVFTVIFGFGLYDTDYVPAFTEHAKAWLGVAIASGFAYFGLNRDGSPIERPAIAGIVIAPASITLISDHLIQKLVVTASDAQNKPIPNLPSDRFQWISDNLAVATVDQTGLVTWKASGDCNITATANAVVSNNCAVKCS